MTRNTIAAGPACRQTIGPAASWPVGWFKVFSLVQIISFISYSLESKFIDYISPSQGQMSEKANIAFVQVLLSLC